MLLEVDGITKHFGGVAAVNGATFGVAEGSITGLIGPNGAGKTTAFNIVSGFLRPDSGAVRFDGRRVDRLAGHAVARAGLVRVFQTARVFTRMSVIENLMVAGRHQPGERFGLAWVRPALVRRRDRDIRRRAIELLERLRLTHLLDAYAGTLSGGQRKLLELGRALMVEPRMILLDEPMAGVAPPLAAELLDHVLALRDRDGITVLLIEHDMEMVMSVSDRIVVMDEGRVIKDGDPRAVQGDPRVIEAYLGRAALPPGGTGPSSDKAGR